MLHDTVLREEIREALIGYFDTNCGSTTRRGLEWDALKAVIRGVCLSKIGGTRRQLEAELTEGENKLAHL